MNVPDPQDTNSQNHNDSMLDARRAALIIIGSVLNARQPFDTVLEINQDFKQLDIRDRAFVRMMVTTALRRLGEIDAFIKRASDKPDQNLQPMLKNILRLGIVQILYLNVPDHAAVDTSVRLAENQGLSKFKGLVNALLRNIARSHGDWEEEIDPSRSDMPEWLLKMLEEDYGAERADSIARASLREAPLDISVKSPEKADQIARDIGGVKLWNGSIRLESAGQVHQLEGYDDGSWWVQDVAASLPVQIMGDIAGRDVIDLCAAPGGKTAQLASAGAYVHSLDRSARRLERFMDNMRRLRLDKNVTPVSADASVWKPAEQADAVILDAPCSATGTIRRNPDIIHLKSQSDVLKMGEVQRNLLRNAADMVKPGGLLIYCTCSLQKREGEDQIDWFLSSDSRFQRVPVTADDLFGESFPITEDGDIRTLPDMLADIGGMDGFFVARLARV